MSTYTKAERKAFNATRIIDIEQAHADALSALALVTGTEQSNAALDAAHAVLATDAMIDNAQQALADATDTTTTAPVADAEQALADNEQALADAEQALADAGAQLANESAQLAVPANKRALTGTISAKQWLIDLLSVADASYTLNQLCALSGKTEVNIRTMLSDLRSERYAGKYGVFKTKSVRSGGVTLYSKA